MRVRNNERKRGIYKGPSKIWNGKATNFQLGQYKLSVYEGKKENIDEEKREIKKGPRGIFQEAYMIDWKIEDGIKALMKNSIDPRMFKDQMIEWAEEAKRAKTKLMKKIEVDEGR